MQQLRVLPGRFGLELRDELDALPPGWLAVARAPDGVTVVLAAEGGRWAALWSGGTAHAPEEPGMLAALLEPLAAAAVPVMVASTFAADVVLVPAERLDAAVAALRAAGHEVDD